MFSEKCKVILSICLCLLVNTSGQDYSSSPCPSVFRYESDGLETYGIIELSVPSPGTTIAMKLDMSSNNTLQLRNLRSDVTKQPLDESSLSKNVRFPQRWPLPKVTSIVHNGQEYCTGLPETVDDSSIILMNITLDDITVTAAVTPDRPTNVLIHPNHQDYKKDILQQNYNRTKRRAHPGNHQLNPENPFLANLLRPANRNRGDTGLSKCGIADGEDFVHLVVMGLETNPGDWPWLTALYINRTTGPFFTCGATLISSKHVVTAGHCVTRQGNAIISVDDILLGFGAYKLFDFSSQNSQVRTPTQILVYPTFSRNPLKSDIAVLIVAEVTFTKFVKPVCLWQGDISLDNIVGRTGTVVGWGRDGSGVLFTSKPLKLEVPIVSTIACRGSHITFHNLTSGTTLCAGSRDGSSPCNGDSGSGLYVRQGRSWSLRGVVSASLPDSSTGFCDTSQYVVYTDAASYGAWFRQLTES